MPDFTRGTLSEPTDELARRLGEAGLRKISTRELLHGFDAVYRAANRIYSRIIDARWSG